MSDRTSSVSHARSRTALAIGVSPPFAVPAAMEADLDPTRQFVHRLRGLIEQALGEDDGPGLSLRVAARRLGTTPRTLQRRLGGLGIGYRELHEEARMTVATRLLREGMTVTRVAQRLGFSQPSAFHRAFKRWSGMAPGRFAKASDGNPP